ncbi:MAG TPA: hypothetical protein VF006_14055 [Longimicrobium sp.]
MLTVHEDERQKGVALRAGYHGFIAMFLAALAVAGVGLFVLENDALGIGGMVMVAVAVTVYHVSLWRGGWFEYVREVTSQTAAARTRARRQALLSVGGIWAWLTVWNYAFDGRSLQRSVLGSLAGALAVGALAWWFYLRRLRSEE